MLGLALFTLVVLGGGGAWLIISVQERSIEEVILGRVGWILHVVVGLAAGSVIALGGWWIISRAWMEPVLTRYARLIGPLMPGRPAQVLVSVCAGVGEELLFRGALQAWLGVPLTAIGFVALHGYLDLRDRRVSSYGIYMTLAMIGLGLLARHLGLLAPMIAHTVIDVILIARLVDTWRADTRVH